MIPTPVPNPDRLSPELQLLLAAMAQPSLEDWLTSRPELVTAIDWKLLLRLSIHHRVYPYLFPRLSRLPEGLIPPGFLGRIGQEYRRNTMQMLQLSAGMTGLAKELAAAGIRSIFLKGPVLAQDLYGELSLRTSRDLDFLVPFKDLEQAEAVLIRLGYALEEPYEGLLGDWKWREHHRTYVHPVSGIKAEIHWRLSPGPSREPAIDELWSRSRVSPLGAEVHFLGREDLFLYLAAHGARHGWSRLRWLLDIRQLLLQQPEPSATKALLRRYRYQGAAGQALLLTQQLFGTPAAPEWAELTGQPRAQRLVPEAMFYITRMVNLHNPPLEPEVEQHYRRYQRTILHPWHQVLYAAGFLYPYAADYHTLPLPKPLHPLYFPLRPLLWTWRKLSGREG